MTRQINVSETVAFKNVELGNTAILYNYNVLAAHFKVFEPIKYLLKFSTKQQGNEGCKIRICN